MFSFVFFILCICKSFAIIIYIIKKMILLSIFSSKPRFLDCYYFLISVCYPTVGLLSLGPYPNYYIPCPQFFGFSFEWFISLFATLNILDLMMFFLYFYQRIIQAVMFVPFSHIGFFFVASFSPHNSLIVG